MTGPKTAIVTGASRGIGHAVALALAANGYHIATIGRSPEPDTLDAMRHITDKGVKTAYVEGSIADACAREALLQKACDLGRVEVLVNNASMAPRERRDLLDVSEMSFDEVLAANLKGSFFLTQAVANEMVKHLNGEGYRPLIVNISSISAETVSVNRAEYCIAKAGLSMSTQLFAVRLAEYGIAVHEIRPGIIETDMIAPVREKYRSMMEKGLAPIKRLGLPEDVAAAVMLLVGGGLAYTTGQVLYVDGGMNIKRL